MNLLKQAREKRAALLARIEELDPINVEEGQEVRSLTDDEKGELKKAVADVTALNEEIRDLEKSQEVRSTVSVKSPSAPKPNVSGSQKRDAGIGMTEKDKQKYSLSNVVRHLANPSDQKLRDAAGFELEVSQEMEKLRGTQARGAFIPHDVMMRTVNKGTSTQGGSFVGTETMGQSFIDMLRNDSVVLGKAQVMSGLVGDVEVPRMDGGSTAYHVAEGADVTTSTPTTGQVTLKPHTIGATVDITRKMLLQSSAAIDPILTNDLMYSIRQMFEYLALYGNGVDEPTGLANTLGIGSYELGTNGAALDWDAIVGLETLVNSANALNGNLGYLTNAKVIGQAKSTSKAANTDRFLFENGQMNGYDVMKSSLVKSDNVKGTGTGLSDIFYGNWEDAIFALWSGLDLTIDNISLAKSGGLRLIGMQDGDYAARHAASFSMASDVDTNA